MRLVVLSPGDSPHTMPWIERFREAQWEVEVWAYPPITQSFGVRVREVDVSGGVLGRWKWLRRELAAADPDVVSQHFINVDLFWLTQISRVPVVASVWGSDLLLDLSRRLKRWMVVRGLRRCALVVSPAKHMTDRLEAFGVDEATIVTAQYGVDTQALRPDPSRIVTDPVIVSARSFAPVYRTADVVEALALLPRSEYRKAILVGDGPLRAELEALRARLGLVDRVEMPGRLTPAELGPVLCDSDVYVSASSSDGASLALIEAMSCGLTPVVSDIPANREWVVDGVNGRLFPVGDVARLGEALRQVIGDAEFRRIAGERSRELAVQRGDRRTNMTLIYSAVARVLGTDAAGERHT